MDFTRFLLTALRDLSKRSHQAVKQALRQSSPHCDWPAFDFFNDVSLNLLAGQAWNELSDADGAIVGHLLTLLCSAFKGSIQMEEYRKVVTMSSANWMQNPSQRYIYV